MSNVIPILSSSPPPIDDPPSFDDSWDNGSDYGGFKAAGTPGGSAFTKQASCITKPEKPFKNIDTPNNGVTSDSPDDGWADFSGPVVAPPPVVDGEFVAFSTDDSKTGSSASVNPKDISLDDTLPAADLPAHMGLQLRSAIDRTVAHGDGRKSPRSSSSSTGSQEDRQNSCSEDFNARLHEPKFPKADTQDNTSQDSVTDSGLCSDISPVPKFEEYPDFGDNKSSEVEFSDDCQSKVGTILEQDEGFANFGIRDSCGTGSDNQSPDTDSADQKLALNIEQHHYPDPLDFRPASFDDETPDDDPGVGVLACSSGEVVCTNSEFDADAVTPTQSQYDADNVRSSNSSSPNLKISPDKENLSENISGELFPDGFQHDKLEEAQTDTSEGCGDTLEGSRAKSAEPESADSFSDFQSTGSVINLSSFQASGGNVGTATTSCDSSGAQPAVVNATSDTSSSAQPSVAINSSHGSTDTKLEANEEPAFDSDDEWDFKDAVVIQPSVEATPTQRQSPDNVAKDPPEPKGSEDDDDGFGDLAARPVQEGEVNEDEDDDWAFQGSGAQGAAAEDDDDEFGDFGDFSSTPEAAGFADFGSSSKQTDDDNNNWASFAEPALRVSKGAADESDDDGEFGDFGEAPFSSAGDMGTSSDVQSSSSVTSQQISATQELLKKEPVEVVVERSFETPSMPNDLPDVELLYKHMTCQDLRQDPTPVKQPGRHTNVKSTTTDVNVWNNLRDLEKTAALRYTWDKSTNSHFLLSALAIDTRNILIGHKMPSVPIFAANLGSGMLEPCRGVPEVGREGRVSEVNTIHANVNTSKLTAGTPQDIPPAEFDWSSAGLTNPLDSSNIQLDLDFFVKKTAWSCYSAYTATSPTAALENELLKSIEPLESKQPKTLEPLANYLANLKVASTAPPSMNQENEADHMTEAAYDIVSHFPQTTFMHAKMLMFPVKGSVD